MKARLALILCLVMAALPPASAQSSKSDNRIRKFPARGTHGAIAGGSEFSTEAGMRMYYHGGNAVDAGVATMFAGALAEISHFGLGGEAPILIRTPQGKVYSIAGVGTMPKMATADFFRKHVMEAGEVMQIDPGGLKGMVPVAGILPALVPGMIDAGLLALREFGTKSFSEEIEPAIELADGMPIDELRSMTINAVREFFDLWPDSKRHFMPNGRVPMAGQIWRRPDAARTLRAMAAAEKTALKAGKTRKEAIDAVRDYFYRGEVAHKIDAFSKANKGLLRFEDMAAFHLEVEEPVSTTYRGYTVYKPGFWSQGPAMIEALNILEGFDLRPLGFNSADYIHKLVESLKLAYADRDAFYGDPKFNKIPPELLTKEYAAKRRELITDKASLIFEPGSPGGVKGMHPSESAMVRIKIDDQLMARDTTCVDAIDKDGLMFSATPSGAWLPSVIAGDTGIPLTARAQSFLLVKGHPNELAGGKRPRVTLSPTLVVKQDGSPYLALSTPGGDNQDQSLLQLMLNVVEFGMNAEAAIEVPRFQTRHLISSFDNHAWNLGDLLLDERISQAVFNELKARGHKVESRSPWNSGAAPVMVKVLADDVLEAGADPWGYRVAHAW